jgi:tryptophan synthase beta chain
VCSGPFWSEEGHYQFINFQLHHAMNGSGIQKGFSMSNNRDKRNKKRRRGPDNDKNRDQNKTGNPAASGSSENSAQVLNQPAANEKANPMEKSHESQETRPADSNEHRPAGLNSNTENSNLEKESREVDPQTSRDNRSREEQEIRNAQGNRDRNRDDRGSGNDRSNRNRDDRSSGNDQRSAANRNQQRGDQRGDQKPAPERYSRDDQPRRNDNSSIIQRENQDSTSSDTSVNGVGRVISREELDKSSRGDTRKPRHSKKALMTDALPHQNGVPQRDAPEDENPQIGPWFGNFGGEYVDQSWRDPLAELSNTLVKYTTDRHFSEDLARLMKEIGCRPTPIYPAKKISSRIGARLYIKMDDAFHTSATLLASALGQALLARRMGRRRVIAPTLDGLSGWAAAIACGHCNLECEILVGRQDAAEASWMNSMANRLKAKITIVEKGTGSWVDAYQQGLELFCQRSDSFMITDAPVGPHPFPALFRFFSTTLSQEIMGQILEKEAKMPSYLVSWGGSGAMAVSAFSEFLDKESVKLVYVEGSGQGDQHAAVLARGGTGKILGCNTRFIAGSEGNSGSASSMAYAMSYPVVGPEIVHLHSEGKINLTHVTDQDAANAWAFTAAAEGILISPQAAHCMHWILSNGRSFSKDDVIVVVGGSPRISEIDGIEKLLEDFDPSTYQF